MAHRWSLAGFYQRLPISILVDPGLERSVVSLSFAVQHDIPRTVTTLHGVASETASGPVTVRTRTGQYQSTFPMFVSSIRTFDLLLGQDWIRALSGHTWQPDISGDSACLLREQSVCAVASDILGVNGSSSGYSGYVGSSMEGLHTDAVRNGVHYEVSEEDADPLRSSSVFFRLTISQLNCRLESHGVDPCTIGTSPEQLRSALIRHLSSGACACGNAPACEIIQRRYTVCDGDSDAQQLLRLRYLNSACKWMKKRPLNRLLKLEGIECQDELTRNDLRAMLKSHIQTLAKAKGRADRSARHEVTMDNIVAKRAALRDTINTDWPQPISSSLKQKIVKMFREATSSESLRSFTCACCAEEVLSSKRQVVSVRDLPLDLLRCHSDILDSPGTVIDIPFREGPLAGVLVDLDGVSVDRSRVQLCKPCASSLGRGRLPALALANRLYVGPVPDELKCLTDIEEVMISQCRAKCCIVRLKDDSVKINGKRTLDNMQRALKGNIIEYPQYPTKLLTVLPPPIEDVVKMVCIIFVGSEPPTREWLLERATPLAVRRDHVRRALLWLKAHNPLYRDIEVNHAELGRIPANGILPYNVETVGSSEEAEMLVSRYDAYPELEKEVDSSHEERETVFQSVVISDVDGHTPAGRLKAAALCHLKDKDGGYLEILHDSTPANEFHDPSLFPRMYPTLYPYGIGGFEDRLRGTRLSFKRHAKHLFSLADKRFQKHTSFLFVVFNILQQREILLRSCLKVRRESFCHVAAELESISRDAVRRVCERVAREEHNVGYTEEEQRVVKLMRHVNLVTSTVPGSSSSKVYMRNQIRAMMLQLGMPSFFITINPADTHNPIVKFLAGKDIDIDDMGRSDIPIAFDQGVLVAKNPFIAAKFFNLYMESFFKIVLGYDHNTLTYSDEGGVLGHVKGYYRCVETQGRGTLHCHMLVWLKGALNPNEIRDRIMAGDADFGARLLEYLDDSISNDFPELNDMSRSDQNRYINPCNTRGVDPDLPDDIRQLAEREDLYLLVKACQVHEHSQTCFKYAKPGEEPRCRFDMYEENVMPQSYFDMETGDLCLQCLNGLVNNFNETMMRVMRCNMDINFIGSGEAAKAILYYITNYITKSQMKAHVAYAALELAINRLAACTIDEDEESLRAKRMLQKCAFALLTHQEMSAPQVALYLLGHEERYPSHQFRNLYWMRLEAYMNEIDPSAECYPLHSDFSEGDVDVPADNDVIGMNSDHPDYTGDITEDGEDELDDMRMDVDVDLTSSDMQDSCDDNGDSGTVPVSEEVLISFDEEEGVVIKADQVSDYIYRPRELEYMSVWHFIRHTSKERIRKGKGKDNVDEAEESQDEMVVDDEAESVVKPLSTADLDAVLNSVGGTSRSAEACLSSAVMNGIYEWDKISRSDRIQVDENMSCELASSKDLEKQWQKFYNTRRDQLKQKVSERSRVGEVNIHSPEHYQSDDQRSMVQFLKDANSRKEKGEENMFLTHLVAGKPKESDADAEIQEVISHWTLNDEQAYTFRIIARHASLPSVHKEQLRMFLGGPGGTGKSRVINALRDFFHRRGEERRFRLASYTGIAASNIRGIMLHTSLGIVPGSRAIRAGSKTHQDLTAMWDGVDYLFVDEVSMLGCYTLARVNEALSLATGKIGPYGGMNIIFAGDFAQLPPVGDGRLYGHVKFDNRTHRNKSAMTKTNRIIYGKLLWLSIDVVVLLTEVMRQVGDVNRRFVDLLSRLRVGACVNDDQHILNSRLLDRLRENNTAPEWRDCPVIVYDNATKDTLNIEAVKAFSRQIGRELHWYYCTDRHLSRELNSDELRDLLLQQHSGTTKGLLGRIPLVLGMKVIISKNFDLDGGVLNGSIGTLRKIRFKINRFGERQLTSCVVYVPESTTPDITELGSKEVPVLEESKKWCIRSHKSRKMLQITRTQVAIQPAYAFTCHRVQRQTFDRIVVDLEGCAGPEAPYIMLSRARSLEGIAILRPFSLKQITNPPNKSLRQENIRLDMICEITKVHGGSYDVDNDGMMGAYAQLTVKPQQMPMSDSEEAVDQRAQLLKDLQLNLSSLTERASLCGNSAPGNAIGKSSGERYRKRPLQEAESTSASSKRRRFHDVLD
ncbi:hypothetical protein NM688_g667 [Phlebia brevispora]|uniref:Uncharacterized protein n=1 Tax=Phlebia brevispora TaxID=194682 RepID=A0ACC1TDP4_9APHY|nr:hypothetical protein NM688_g667 [Phlebia brevispora]